MLVGAVMGFWARAAHRRRSLRRDPRRRDRRCGDGADPRVPRRHAAREPDRLGARADDLRGRGRAFVVPRQRPQPRRPAGAALVRVRSCPHSLADGATSSARSSSTRSVLVYASWVCVAARRALPQPHAARAERARGRRVAGGGRRDGDQRRALPLRAHARRRCVRGRRRRVLLARDHAAVGRRAHRRRRLDRDRARHLRLLAARRSASSARTSSAPSRASRSRSRRAGS